ncbi:MAG TPA: ClpX C4-type zinc finger protein [Rhizomicrobium sp.]|nr:ClpX C4-type zinc finger protein [Rhizomicrobium sp.]
MNAKPQQPASDNTLYCSFCRKSQHDVKKMVAGPAVLICDSCVAIAAKVIADTSDITPPPRLDWPEKTATKELLAILAGQDSLYREVRERVQETVDILRKREVSWADIAAALNVSRQAAWERFS